MNKEKITGKEVVCMMVLFMLGSSSVTGGSIEAKQDSWMSIIVAVIMMIPLVFIYARFSRLAPEQDLFDISYTVFGKIGGAIITIIFSFYTIHLGGMVIRNFTEFIQVVSLPETPQSINAICFGIIAIFTVKKGIEILGRGVAFTLPVVIFTMTALALLAISQMDIDYIKPILNNDIRSIFSGAVCTLTFPFAETVMFISIFPTVDNKKNPTKLYLIAILIPAVILTIANIRNILVLGIPVIESLYFPSYSVIGVINIGEFITRIEVLVSGMFIVSGLVKVSVCLYVSCKGIAKLFNIDDYKMLAAPLALLMIALSDSAYKSTMEMLDFIKIYKYYSPIFQMIIPIIVLIFAEIKIKKGKKIPQ